MFTTKLIKKSLKICILTILFVFLLYKINEKKYTTMKITAKDIKKIKRQVEKDLNLYQNMGSKVYKNKKAYDRKRDRKVVF